MILTYKGKKTEKEILEYREKVFLKTIEGKIGSKSRLIRGENLSVMKYFLYEEGLAEKIDLVYIDPPFSTNNIFTISKEKASTISRSNGDAIAYTDSLLGENYFEFLRERLILLRELLSNRGSIYVHIDCKVGHYVKVLMDEIFGKKNFLADITRIKCNPKNFERRSFGNIKDMILFYSKAGNHIWNEPKEELNEEDIKRLFKKIDKDGRRYTTIPLHAPGETQNGETGKIWKNMPPPKGRHWRCSPSELDKLEKEGLVEWSKTGVPRKKIYADERRGKKIQDIWEFKDPQNPKYPTEKNLDLLKLIISSSSNQESIILDCFCGSGTALIASEELGRRWIGIDSSEKAIKVAKGRLSIFSKRTLYQDNDYEFCEQIDSNINSIKVHY
jgi:adenine-specific DNA-methyltransferase